GLMIWIAIRFNHKSNPTPRTFTHNSPLEVAWTIVPIIILVFVGAFSLPILFKQQEIPEADITIKVTGYQWYWGYEYVDEGVAFESRLIDAAYFIPEDEDGNWGSGQPMDTPYSMNDVAREKLAYYGWTENEFLLATDQSVVVPIGATIVMQLTGADVIHSWTIPAFGVKQDAVPGRLSQLWFAAEREGIYFGQCSELCGKDHAYMPITVKVVSQETYDAWLIEAKDINGV
ncbi:MAG: cytochrome c oxidase subunit 2, partial [Gammaproteobacteria bacterium]